MRACLYCCRNLDGMIPLRPSQRQKRQLTPPTKKPPPPPNRVHSSDRVFVNLTNLISPTSSLALPEAHRLQSRFCRDKISRVIKTLNPFSNGTSRRFFKLSQPYTHTYIYNKTLSLIVFRFTVAETFWTLLTLNASVVNY